VRDHGPGIRPDDRERLFHSYTHGSARAGSLGLGLYISKTLIEAHGGRIGVDPNPGKGSTFWMEFPDRELPTRRQRSEV
jgi:signal transduction histidine kinase